MKVLIDECAPRALKLFLTKQNHECLTVQEAGWSGKQNGELLTLAEAAYQVFVTIDANLEYQQNLTGRTIAIIVLIARSNKLVDLLSLFPLCAAAIDRIEPGEIVTVGT